MSDVNWREWSDAAFEEARVSGKPVLLDISAVWCHWCHVMDSTTYSNPTVVGLINDLYIPIRVDSDRNPDINARYNVGGWPTTAFLTHERDVIAGATYLPPERMVSVLRQMHDVYAQQDGRIIETARRKRAEVESLSRSVSSRPVGQNDVARVLAAIRTTYDPQHGGFGRDQKFPHPSALDLLLFDYEKTGDAQDLAMVADTLQAMIEGEIFDPVEGGMFRYATRRDWTVPHYEKMLGDNARIASVLLDAYRLTGTDDFLRTARRIFLYMQAVLLDPAIGVFHGSQDADEQYYRRDAGGRREVAPPRVDPAFYTDSNAAAAVAYLKFYGVTGDARVRDRALETVGFLNALPRGAGGTVCHYVADGEPHLFGVLSDIAFLSLANSACCEAAGRDDYLAAAKELADVMVAEFASDTGALFDISSAHAQERGLGRYGAPISENSTAAVCLLKIAGLTGDSVYRDLASRALAALADRYADYGILAADYALAVALLGMELRTKD